MRLQYIEAPVAADPDEANIARSMAWALDNLSRLITVADLAAEANMSSRTYLRHVTRSTGTSPASWLIGRRVQASLELLETTEASIEDIATAVGFATAVTYRHHFSRALQTSPTAYRRTFRNRSGHS